tara:strand:+ start:196 stop:513 length:318 start_codon:yes stop_codon:yes gene_type:complete
MTIMKGTELSYSSQGRWRVMTLTDAKEHHIQKAAELNALQCAEMNEGRDDMKTDEMINYHMARAVELRAQEIVEAKESEQPRWYGLTVALVVGLVVGGAVVSLIL